MKTMMKAGVCAGLALLAACATTPPASKTPPDWVSGYAARYPASAYLLGRGAADTPNAAIALIRGPRVVPSAPRPVTEDQAVGLIAEPAFDPDRDDWEVSRDQAVLTLLYGCGLRISEALSLKRSDAPVPETLRILGKGGRAFSKAA